MEDVTPRRRLSREDVVHAALRILDDYGLADLTMRRLAAALDVQPSALYWHFANKQTIIAELSDRILGRARPADAAADGPARLRAEALALRDALLAYRDGADVVASTLALGLGSVRPQDRLVRAIAEAGFDPGTARGAATALTHFVLGHVSHEQQRMQYESLGVRPDDSSPDAVDDGDSQREFLFGVGLLVGGLMALRPASSRARG
ncbi:TetR/AcrR family transcriptional regulator C-terminal domain-containing protein [Microbacterium sp. X-17]|uniref:TetR/AcrR family transcriptional regulator C-terminal domain-containing protein n=1 Tax=Microbacterium sp. X-17 TaxID=3144404 RepID=UPI0031F4CED5